MYENAHGNSKHIAELRKQTKKVSYQGKLEKEISGINIQVSFKLSVENTDPSTVYNKSLVYADNQ